MNFSEKLKQAMQQLGISQAQLVGLTGIGKSSISQYLSGKNVPPEERRKYIAVSIGLEADGPMSILWTKKVERLCCLT